MLLFTLIYVDVIAIVTNVTVTLLSTLNKFFLLLLLLHTPYDIPDADNKSCMFIDGHALVFI